MLKSSEHFTFKGEALSFVLVRVNHLFEGKQVVLDPVIPHKVDSTKSALTKQALDNIAASSRVAYSDSDRKYQFSCCMGASDT